MPIDIRGLDRCDVLCALHDLAIPKVLHRGYPDGPLDREQASRMLEEEVSFHYVNGRALFVNLAGPFFDPEEYDGHNRRPGLAAKALAPLIARASGLGKATTEADRDYARRLFPDGVPTP